MADDDDDDDGTLGVLLGTGWKDVLCACLLACLLAGVILVLAAPAG